MSPIGGGKPLFDLIPNGRRPDADAPGSPGEHPPRADESRESRSRSARSHADRSPVSESRAALSGVVRIPGVWLYGIGYRLGVADEKQRWREQASREAQNVFVDDPLADRQADRKADRRADAGEGRAEPAPPAPEPAQATILTATGPAGNDPRIEGNNYLELATLPRDQAEQAVRYLAGRGIEAIAVPRGGVDRRRNRSNTTGPYRVVAIDLAVPSDRYSALRREREGLERRVKRAGKAWAEAGGASDFSDPLWRRYGG